MQWLSRIFARVRGLLRTPREARAIAPPTETSPLSDAGSESSVPIDLVDLFDDPEPEPEDAALRARSGRRAVRPLGDATRRGVPVDLVRACRNDGADATRRQRISWIAELDHELAAEVARRRR